MGIINSAQAIREVAYSPHSTDERKDTAFFDVSSLNSYKNFDLRFENKQEAM
jgi:hypothetical protein